MKGREQNLADEVPAIAVVIAEGSDAARSASLDGDVIVVVDALRASSTIVSALFHGVKRVDPVATLEECAGELVAAEKNAEKWSGADLDNSPRSFLDSRHSGRVLTLKTTNGTVCLLAAKANPGAHVLVGALLNAEATAGAALAAARDENRSRITIVACGRRGGPAVEDTATAELIASRIREENFGKAGEVAAPDTDYQELFQNSDTGRHLESLGHAEDISLCALLNGMPIAVHFDGKSCKRA
jgi:phosphosulfolactate phosphohydrolase-like enzyme